jgi:hypothetical protein
VKVDIDKAMGYGDTIRLLSPFFSFQGTSSAGVKEQKAFAGGRELIKWKEPGIRNIQTK